MKKMILGVSASIAAYKAADLINRFKEKGFDVHVVMTEKSQQIIPALTLESLSKNPVYIDVMKENNPKNIDHIDIAKSADVFLIAPATANIIGKLANGIADDALSTIALVVKDIPKFIAPAMNTAMYENSIVQENIKKLVAHGYSIIEPRESMLACGDVGKGALAEVQAIIGEVLKALK